MCSTKHFSDDDCVVDPAYVELEAKWHKPPSLWRRGLKRMTVLRIRHPLAIICATIIIMLWCANVRADDTVVLSIALIAITAIAITAIAITAILFDSKYYEYRYKKRALASSDAAKDQETT